MASDALFGELAKALSRPPKAYQALETGLEIPQKAIGAYYDVKGLQQGLAEKRANLINVFGQVSDSIGKNNALRIMGPTLKDAGVDSDVLNQPVNGAGMSPSPTDLGSAVKSFRSGDIGGKELSRTMQGVEAQNKFEQNRPRTVAEVRQTLMSGGIDPREANQWISQNTNTDGTIPNRNYDDFIKVKGLANNNSKSGFYGARTASSLMDQLPSKNQSSAGGQAYGVMFASRQGRSLIADPLKSPQQLALASGDMARAVLRAAPQQDAQTSSRFTSLGNELNVLSQKLSSGNVSPQDMPALRKQAYDIFTDLENTSKPIVANSLADIEDTYGPQGALPPNWKDIKSRNLGENLPDIPFNAGTPTVNTGAAPVPGMLTIRDSQGQMHSIPEGSLQKAKQRDPGLQVVTQ